MLKISFYGAVKGTLLVTRNFNTVTFLSNE